MGNEFQFQGRWYRLYPTQIRAKSLETLIQEAKREQLRAEIKAAKEENKRLKWERFQELCDFYHMEVDVDDIDYEFSQPRVVIEGETYTPGLDIYA